MPAFLTPLRLFFLGALVALTLASVFTVTQTEQALVVQFGKPIRPIQTPGLQFKLPYQNLVFFDRRVLDLDSPPEDVILQDQKRLVVDTLTRYRITDPLKYFRALGNQMNAEQRLRITVRSTLRSVFGKIVLTDILSAKRTKVMQEMRTQLDSATKEFGIVVVDFRIRQADLPAKNSEAIFESMKAERQKEANEFRAQGQERALRIRSEAEKDKQILLAEAFKKAETLRGEGDAKSAEIYAAAFSKDPKFYEFWRSLSAYREALSGKNTTYILSPKSGFFKHFTSGILD